MNSFGGDCITVQASAIPVPEQNADAGELTDVALTRQFSRYAERLAGLYENLQSANQTVGYLESQLKDYQTRASLMSELDSRSASIADAERENKRLAALLPELEETARKSALIAGQNRALRSKLEQIQGESDGWLTRLADLIVGDDDGQSARPRRLAMSDYYHMIQVHLES